jgi:hypothetical protein
MKVLHELRLEVDNDDIFALGVAMGLLVTWSKENNIREDAALALSEKIRTKVQELET